MYIYDNEDNVPMNDENMPNAPERDCQNCRHKLANGDCTQWMCNFAPKEHIVREVQEWLAKTNSAGAETGAK